MESLTDKIKRVFEAEDHAKSVRSASEVPTSYASLTTEWLTNVACKARPGAKVVDFKLDHRDDGSSNRQRMTIVYNQAGVDAGLPQKVFCKASERLDTRTVLGASGAGETEVNFYNKVRPRLDIEAPVPVYAGFDPTNFASNPTPEMSHMQPKRTTLTFLSRLFAAIDDHDAFASLDA